MWAMKKVGIILILSGLFLIFSGIAINKSTNQQNEETSETMLQTSGSSNQSAFTDFISKRFSRRYFHVSKMDPVNDRASADLMVEYEIRGVTGRFFLKTKWYLRYHNSEIEVANRQDVLNYQTYLEKFDEPMFKIIGIGGQPSKPKLIYIIPLEEINSTSLTINEISRFSKDDQSANFFFDINDNSLR
jgi:Cft2 family RNA processing exonuclease